MKNLYTAILLLLNFCSIAQTYQGPLPFTTTSTTFGNNTITVTQINSPCPGAQCGIPITHGYWSGCSVPNGFSFSFVNPLSDIRLKIAGINDGETLKVKINNAPYVLTAANVSTFSGTCSPTPGTANTFTATGELTSTQPTTGTADNAQIDIHAVGGPIYSFEVFEDVVNGVGGSVFEVYFVNDTCFTNNTNVTAIASQYTCNGDTLFLNANTLNGASYHWYGPNGFFSSSEDTFITNVTTAHSGLYIVEADRGICHYSDDTLLTVVAPPIPSNTTNNSPGPINKKCAGNDIDFSTTQIPGVTYQWTGPANFLAVSSDADTTRQKVPSTGDGWYYVRTIKNGCLSKPDSTKVMLDFPELPPVAGGNTEVCPGTTLNLTATHTASGLTYNWTGPGNFSSTQQNTSRSNITYADSGYYYVTATNANGCITEPDTIKIDVKILTPTPNAGGDTVACPGTTLHLAASNIPNATYAWFGPGSFSSTSQNPLKPNVIYPDSGYYYVKATVLGCTSLPDTIKVAVRILTPTPEASGDSVVCPGTELNLSASTIPNATYSWIGPGFTAQTQNPSLPVTTASEGFYVVTASVNGCVSLPDSIDIKVRITTPTPEAGSDSPVCSDGELRLTASDVPNATYSWSGPRITSTQQNPVTTVWMEDAGAYVVTANIGGCISLPDTVMVTIKERPILRTGTNSPVCEHDTLSLIANSAPYSPETIYSWTGPEGFTSASERIDLADAKLQQSGLYIVTATMNGCISHPDTLAVQVDETLPNPIADASPVFNGEKLQLTGKGLVPGMTFNWTGPNYFTSTEENPIIDPATEFAEGLYILTTTLGGCSSSDSTLVKVKINKYFTLYPNPNNGNFIVKGDVQKDQKIKLEIISSTGQTVYRNELTTQNKHFHLPVQMVGLPHGVYLIRLEIDGKTKDMRFVVSQ